MYVCICHAITDRQIREVVECGARSLCEVQQHLPVASCCGCCAQTAHELIDEHVQATAQPVAA
jgi:bacterioferritin-associated ferredoxin